jgi:hypothetical protein
VQLGEDISPKVIGGWGILNIFYFSKSLAAITLWRVLMGEGVWHRVIIDKYLCNTNVITWLRSRSFQQSGVSKIWGGLLKVVYLILHGLSWNLGSGHLIALGKDWILGMGDNSFLSIHLQDALRDKDIQTLAQMRNPFNDQTTSSYWLTSDELGLEGDLALEWEMYRRALIDSGALIQDNNDQLLWIGGDKSGIPSAKNFYSSIISSKSLSKVESWRLSIWNWKIQLKVKLFIWLAIEDKILTWNMLQKKGWEGPG